MQIATYRKNVMKTVNPKAVKYALKVTSKNTARSLFAFAVVAAASATGDVIDDLTPYILGDQFTESMKNTATISFGSLGYSLVVLAKLLKVKVPSASKKTRLTGGTRTAALLGLNHGVNQLTTLFGTTLTGPIMKQVEKDVVLPKKGGIKEKRMVNVVDKAEEDKAEAVRMASAKEIVEGLVDIYWRLTFDTFGFAPEKILEAQFETFKNAYPEGTFVTDDSPAIKAAKEASAGLKKAGKKAKAAPKK